MPRKGEDIYKRKDGRWEGRYIKGYHPSGKAIYGYVYAYTYRDVKCKLNDAINRKVTEDTTHPKDDSSFQDLSKQWLANQQARIKESTYNKYSNILITYILPSLDPSKMEEITYERIMLLYDNLLTKGGKLGTGLSQKTVADTMSVIRNIMLYSSRQGYKCPCDLSLIRVKQPTKELRVLTRTEQNILYSYLSNNLTPYNVGILICLFTGLRIGEVCALQWEDISFSNHTIYVHQTMQRIQNKNGTSAKTKIVITPPKTASAKRIIPIPQNLEEILASISSVKTGFVLSQNGMKYIEPRLLQYHFTKTLNLLQIQQVNFHILRHTFATRCIELGFDVKSLSEILGHSNVSITMNRYVHPSMNLKRENMQRLSALFSVK